MKIKLRAEGFKLKDGVMIGLENKLGVIDSLLPEGILYDVLIKTTNNNAYKCEIKVQRGEDFIRSEAQGSRIEYAINNSIKILKKRVYKLKTMKIDKKRKHFAEDVIFDEDLDLDLDSVPVSDIKRFKYIEASVMPESDAIFELEALNHSFYVFRNANKDCLLSVLYRRETDYGLLVIE